MHKNKFIFVLYLQLNLPVRQSVLGSWINLQGKTLIRTDEQQERSKFVWLQVLCNAAMALGLSLLYLLDHGSADLPVVFRWVSDIQTLYSAAVSPRREALKVPFIFKLKSVKNKLQNTKPVLKMDQFE